MVWQLRNQQWQKWRPDSLLISCQIKFSISLTHWTWNWRWLHIACDHKIRMLDLANKDHISSVTYIWGHGFGSECQLSLKASLGWSADITEYRHHVLLPWGSVIIGQTHSIGQLAGHLAGQWNDNLKLLSLSLIPKLKPSLWYTPSPHFASTVLLTP